MLIVGRAVAGIGASGLINGAITMVSSAVPIERRPGMYLTSRSPRPYGIPDTSLKKTCRLMQESTNSTHWYDDGM